MYQKTVLDNGLTVVTERIPEFRSCSLGVWVGTGSRFESDGQAGLSHFLEHMLFKGTATRTAYDIAVSMDGVGGQLNAFTEKEHTCYYARVMDRHMPLALDILSDMTLNSLLDDEELEREKGVILEEIKMFEDTPDSHIFDLFTRALYPEHPLGRPVIGTAEVVSNLTRPELVAYLKGRYVAGNLMVAAAGQVEHEQFVEQVRANLCPGLPAALAPREHSAPEGRSGTTVYSKDCEQAYFCYGCPGLAHTDERRYILLVMDSVLGGSMSSRLFQEIREKRGLVYSVGTFQHSYLDCGIFGVYAGTSAGRLDQVLQLTRDILADVRRNGLREDELNLAREHLKGALALGMESTSNRMMRMARNELYHRRFVTLEEVIAKIDAVGHDDIAALAEWILDPARFTLTVLGPVDQVDGVRACPLPDLETAHEAAARRI